MQEAKIIISNVLNLAANYNINAGITVGHYISLESLYNEGIAYMILRSTN